jgi:hypothetical protein
MGEPIADRLKPAATQTFVRLRGLLKIKDSLEPAKAGFVCIAPDFQSVGNWNTCTRHFTETVSQSLQPSVTG